MKQSEKRFPNAVGGYPAWKQDYEIMAADVQMWTGGGFLTQATFLTEEPHGIGDAGWIAGAAWSGEAA